MRRGVAVLLVGLVMAGLGMPAIAGAGRGPGGGRVAQAASGPKVDRVQLEEKLIRRETRLTEEQDFAVVVSARVLPGPGGRPVRAAGIAVSIQDVRVDGGQRTYDAKTGVFTLTLGSEAHMALLPRIMAREAQGLTAAHAVVVSAVDEAGRNGQGHYDPPKGERATISIESHVSWTDAYGRSRRADDRASGKRLPHVAGRPLGLVGPGLDARSPLRLRLLARHAFPAPPIAAAGETQLVVAPDASLGLVWVGAYRTVLMRLAPSTGQVLETRDLLAPPEGRVQQLRWLGGRPHQLAARPGPRYAVEARDADRRVALPYAPHALARGEVADFVAGDAGIMYVERDMDDYALAGCDRAGAFRWRLAAGDLLPGTNPMGAGSYMAIAPTAGGTLAFVSGSDYGQPDEPPVMGVAEVGWDGELRAARLLVASPAEGPWVDGGAAVAFQGRRLMVIYRRTGEEMRAETAVYDMDAQAAEPLLVLPGADEGGATFGAVVLGDRLVIACGADGYAVLACEK